MDDFEPLDHKKIVEQNNALVDAFFNFTLTPELLKKYEKPKKLDVVPLERPKEKPKKRKFAHKGTSYATQYGHKDKSSSNPNNSTMVSGPLHQFPSTFVEKPVTEEDEIVLFGTLRNICFRKNLPIHKHHMKIMHYIENSPVTLIQGATGCGKSTQVPQYIYDTCAKKNKPCSVLISQPRKIAAVTIAYRVAKERDTELGKEVGYQVSLDRCTGDELGERTQITYCTTGVILQKFIEAKSMNAYTHVILDEVHERTVETDLLIAIIRRFLNSNSPKTKVILMSATMDSTDFIDFFKMPTDGPEPLLPPVIDLTHDERNFPITEYFIDDLNDISAPIDVRKGLKEAFRGTVPEISSKMYSMATQLITFLLAQHNQSMAYHTATVLVFLPGIYEIEEMKRELLSYADNNLVVPFNILILHSMLSTEEQKKAFVVSKDAKIILSTNIAESSITIPSVTHVINFCLSKKLDTDPKMNRLQTLVCVWATKNHCQQRAGRTGRVCNGMVIHLVTKDFYHRKMRKHPKPEILELPLESVILNVKKLGMGTPLEILGCSIDPPPYEAIVEAVLRLKEMGGLNRTNNKGEFEFDNGDITFIGEIMAALPCDPRISKLIIMGYVFSVLEETLIIGAGLSIQGLFKKTSSSKMNDFKNKVKWADESQSDLIAMLNIYTKWREMKRTDYFKTENFEAQWCTENGIDFKNINEMGLWIAEVQNRLRHFKIESLPHGRQPVWNGREKAFAVKIAIAAAFGIGNFCIPALDITCERDAFNMVESLDPRNTVYFRNMPKDLIGRVYEPQITQAFVNEGVCNDISKIKVSFDAAGQSERVFVSFLDDYDDDGKIPQEVYNAVKLRRLKSGITIGVMPPDETLNYAIEKSFGRLVDGKYIENKTTFRNPEYCALPTCFEKELQGYVTHVVSFSKFYFKPHVSSGPDFQKLNTRHNNVCKRINQILRQTELKALKSTKECSVGDILAVNFEDNIERGEVKTIKDNVNMTLKLIDIGNDIDVVAYDCSSILNLADRKEIETYPPRAILCRLQEVRPAGFFDKWNDRAIEEFALKVKGEKMKIKVYSVVNDVVSVKLYQDQLCWNEKVVGEKVAIECEETFGSKMDHHMREIRRKSFLVEHKRVIEPREEFQKKIITNNIQPTPLDLGKCQGNVFLKGPVSPLEVPIKGICKQVSGYLTIDGSSVNQVMLNDINRQGFCVAAEIYLDSDYDAVKIRETTVYPNLPGLPVLLALMFGNKIQINRDEDKTRYTSILCGLGADENNVPFYAARDASLYVDFDLQPNDIIGVNNLRFLISKLLYVQPHIQMRVPNLGDGQRENLLRRIKDQLVRILTTTRTRRETDETGVIFEWNKDIEDIEKQPTFDNHIFEFIEYPKLFEMSREKKLKLLDHAEDLETGGHKYMKLYSQECKLCNVFWGNRSDLTIHLLSSLHQKRKAELIKSLEE